MLLSKEKQHNLEMNLTANSPSFSFCLAVFSLFAGWAKATGWHCFCFSTSRAYFSVGWQKQTHILESSPSPQQPPSVWFTAGDDSVISLLYYCCCCCYFTRFGMWAFWDGVGCVGSCGWWNCLFFLSLLGLCLSVCSGRVINELLMYVLGIILRRFACR